MEAHLLAKDAKLNDKIAASYDSLIFLATLTVLMVIVAIEVVFAQLIFGSWEAALWSIALLILAYLFYRAAILQADSWGRGTRTAFDLYLDDAGDLLDLLQLDKYNKEGYNFSFP
jgi:hypothetical protein